MSQKSDAEGTSVMDDQCTGNYATRKPASSPQKRKWGGDGSQQGRKTKRRDLGRGEWGYITIPRKPSTSLTEQDANLKIGEHGTKLGNRK